MGVLTFTLLNHYSIGDTHSPGQLLELESKFIKFNYYGMYYCYSYGFWEWRHLRVKTFEKPIWHWKWKSFLTALYLYLLPAPLTICYQILYCFLLLGIAVKLEKKWKKKKTNASVGLKPARDINRSTRCDCHLTTLATVIAISEL